jgi:two-component system, response regulator
MSRHEGSFTVLVAEDDPDDRLLLREAWQECRLPHALRFVSDGEELVDYLKRHGRFPDPGAAPRPDLILLDLNMPRMDGREALRAIKSDPALRAIPVIVLTTSEAEEDIVLIYDRGGSSFIVKPTAFDRLVDMVRTIDAYWLSLVELAASETGRST